MYMQVETYYKTGCADPHHGVSGKAWKGRKQGHVNPTMLRPGAQEFHVDYMVSPFLSYLPLTLDK